MTVRQSHKSPRPKLTTPDDQFRLPFLFEVRPPSEFAYEAAKSKLGNLRLGDTCERHVNFVVPGDLPVDGLLLDGEIAPGQQGRLLGLAGLVDMESRLTVRFGL